jgi:GDP-L-fucose synthase
MFLGSSCIYPRLAPQPIPETALLTGPLEPTNEWYAVAKIAGIKLCQALRRQHGFNAVSVMPTNLYGPGDNFHPENSHVLPALIRRFVEAKEIGLPEVVVWGSGQPLREFLHIDDFADAAVFLMEKYDGEEIVNIGAGTDVTIRELAELVGDAIGYKGNISYDQTKLDGVPRKLLDTSRLNGLGWSPRISLRDGILATCEWFKRNRTGIRE